MLLDAVGPRAAAAIRLAALALIAWSVANSRHAPGGGRGVIVAISLAVCVLGWLAWTARPQARQELGPEVLALALAGSVLLGAAPDSAAGAFVFIAVVTAAMRVELTRAIPVLVVAVLALALAVLVYDGSALGLLAYALGFCAAALAASTRRSARLRFEQAELLLAQTQRSHEEQLRAARLQESTRIAREIHDVLAHTLAGLTIQLEATASLVEQGAGREDILARLRRARELSREGLDETRRAVGALRGEPVSARAGIEALVANFRATAPAPVELAFEGPIEQLDAHVAETAVRVVQEALTNVSKHAPQARVTVAVLSGAGPDGCLVVRVDDLPPAGAAGARPAGTLADSGGGYGLQGMRERAQLLGGTLSAGAHGAGWRVEMRVPFGQQATLTHGSR
jgi:signal transduction histidine kinase